MNSTIRMGIWDKIKSFFSKKDVYVDLGTPVWCRSFFKYYFYPLWCPANNYKSTSETRILF